CKRLHEEPLRYLPKHAEFQYGSAPNAVAPLLQRAAGPIHLSTPPPQEQRGSEGHHDEPRDEPKRVPHHAREGIVAWTIQDVRSFSRVVLFDRVESRLLDDEVEHAREEDDTGRKTRENWNNRLSRRLTK